MTSFSMTWLASALRAEGVQVVESPGWMSRGRGEMGQVRGVMCHHTGGPRLGNSPSLALIVRGRDDLPGPLSQIHLARDGTATVIAAGRCNHAGAGEWQGITTGNTSFIGVEAENSGVPSDPWPDVQMDAYVKVCAGILRHIKAPPAMVCGHREYARPRGRKIDPLFDMTAFRALVSARLNAKAGDLAAPPLIGRIEPARSMLRAGSPYVDDVRALQRALRLAGHEIRIDGDFGPATDRAVRAFQVQAGLTSDGLVGPATWAKLAPYMPPA